MIDSQTPVVVQSFVRFDGTNCVYRRTPAFGCGGSLAADGPGRPHRRRRVLGPLKGEVRPPTRRGRLISALMVSSTALNTTFVIGSSKFVIWNRRRRCTLIERPYAGFWQYWRRARSLSALSRTKAESSGPWRASRRCTGAPF